MEIQISIKKNGHCRFCAEELTGSVLFNWTEDAHFSNQFINMLECLKLDSLVSDSQLPTTTCEQCYNSLSAAYFFVDKAKQSQVILHSIYDVEIETKPLGILNVKTEDGLDSTCDDGNSLTTCIQPQFPVTKFEVECGNDVQNLNNTILPKKEKKAKSLKRTEENTKHGHVRTVQTAGLYNEMSQSTSSDSSEVGELDVKDDSWTGYKWICLHCGAECKNMFDLRTHSKVTHSKCFGFKCIDCIDHFNIFNSFVEHVRQHRISLKGYCQYCNIKLDGDDKDQHIMTHWTGSQRICCMCGEICPNPETLDRHRKMYRLVRLPTRDYRMMPRVIVRDHDYNGTSSWEDYEWTCQDCCVRMPDVHTLRAHARDFHNKCFSMKCVDCLKVRMCYNMFVKHVQGHRPYLRQFCQFCNQKFEDPSKMQEHIEQHLNGSQKPCDGCGQIFDTNALLSKHLKIYDPPRRKGTLTTEDMTCDLCGKVFGSLGALRNHRDGHDKKKKPNLVCDICGKCYFRQYMLGQHMKTHDDSKSEVCQMCNKGFQNIQRLRAHLKTHVNLKSFTCDECGKHFRSKFQLSEHIVSHTKVFKFQCTECGKKFTRKHTLKIHMNTHLASSPYNCSYCEKTFNCWPNCNKHMIRKHGVPLAKTKLTPQGRIQINKETGNVIELETNNLSDWINEVMRPRKRKKQTKSTIA